MATSAPRPPVSFRISAAASVPRVSIARSAPSRRASASRSGSMSAAATVPHPSSLQRLDREEADRAGADDEGGVAQGIGAAPTAACTAMERALDERRLLEGQASGSR